MQASASTAVPGWVSQAWNTRVKRLAAIPSLGNWETPRAPAHSTPGRAPEAPVNRAAEQVGKLRAIYGTDGKKKGCFRCPLLWRGLLAPAAAAQPAKRHFYPSSPRFYPAQPGLHSEPQPSRGALGRGVHGPGCCCKEAASPLPPPWAVPAGTSRQTRTAAVLLPASPADPPPSERRARPAGRCWRSAASWPGPPR